jgi:hypothetical protein
MDAFSKIVAPRTLEGLRHVVEKSGGHGCASVDTQNRPLVDT